MAYTAGMTMNRQGLLSIGEFAQVSLLSLKALRLYDQLQLLTPAYIDPESNYRYYRTEQLAMARLIRLMRQMEMPLATIRRVLSSDPTEAARLVHSHAEAFQAKAKQVRQTADTLLLYLTKEAMMAFAVEIQKTPKQLVLSITKRVYLPELSSFISSSVEMLEAHAAKHGCAISGPPFGIYHGAVSQTENGPVEVCLPIIGSYASVTAEIAVKELPAAELACVAVSGKECAFPAILEAYDAACDWIVRNGYESDSPPQEIWVGPDEQGPMVIAWPFREKE